MNRPTAALLVLGLVLTMAGCGGGVLSGSSGPPPSPPPSPASPAFVYFSNTSTDMLTAINVAGGRPTQLGTSLPPPGGAPIGLVATGKYLYIANSGSATISGFSFNASTGVLQPLPGQPYFAASGVNQLALCPGNGGATPPKFVYAASPTGVLGHNLTSTGQLTPLAGSPFSGGSQPAGLITDSACNFVIVANRGSNNLSAFSVNSSSGFLTPVPGSPFSAGTAPVALAMGDGFLFAANFGSNNVSAYTVSTSPGAGRAFLTPVAGAPFAAGSAPTALVYVSPTLYVANSASNNVSAFTVAASTGLFTPVTGSPFSVGTTPMAMITLSPPASNVAQQVFLYVANAGSNDVSAFTFGTGGALTVVQGFPFPAGTDPEGLVFACGVCGYP